MRFACAGSHGLIACVAMHGDDFGPPLDFPRRCCAELLKLDGDASARPMLDAMPADTLRRRGPTTIRRKDAVQHQSGGEASRAMIGAAHNRLRFAAG